MGIAEHNHTHTRTYNSAHTHIHAHSCRGIRISLFPLLSLWFLRCVFFPLAGSVSCGGCVSIKQAAGDRRIFQHKRAGPRYFQGYAAYLMVNPGRGRGKGGKVCVKKKVLAYNNTHSQLLAYPQKMRQEVEAKA
jgi:hypothetical protein